MIFLFDQGIAYITYKKGKTLDISLKPFLCINTNFRRYLFIAGYFIFAWLGVFILLVMVNLIKFQIIVNTAFIFVSVAFITTALLCLMLEDKLKDADDFIRELNAANEKYKNIEKPRTIILLDRNSQPS